MGGGKNYADVYAKYKPESNFTSYVDKYPDLRAAWKKIEDDPSHPDSQYWIKRGATSKEAFGRAHAAEDSALKGGTYMGATDFRPGTEALKGILGPAGNTRYEQFLGGASTGGDGSGGSGGSPAVTGGRAPGSALYPMGLVDYTEPEAMAGIPLAYQPWIQPDHIPDSLWNYQPPTLVEWDVSPRDRGWATTDVSEYVPVKETTATNTNIAEGEQDSYNPMNDPANYMPGHEGDPRYYTGPDPTWDASASRKSFDWNNPLGAWANKNILGMEDSNTMAAKIAAANAASSYPSMDMSAGVVDTTGLGFDMGETDAIAHGILGTGAQ